jgi:hypothetical protein
MKFIKYLLIFLVFTSCDFEFENDFINKKIVEVNTNFDIQLKNFNNDIILREPTIVSFNAINKANERLIEINFFIDDFEVYNSKELTGNFTIDTDVYEQGNHKLEIVYSFFSGSGSLADITNQEGFIVSKVYDFSIDKSLRNPIDILEVKKIDGSVYVYWNKDNIDGVYDEATILLDYETPEGELVNIEKSLSKSDLRLGVFNDVGLINGKTTYTIRLSNRYKFNEGKSQTFQVVDNFNLELTYLSANKYRFKWNRHELYNNFGYYSWYGYGLRNVDNSTFSSIGGERDVDGSLTFGADYQLVLLPKATKEYRHGSNREINLTLGKYFIESLKGNSRENIQGAIYSKERNSYYFLHFDNYSAYNPEMKILEFNADDFSLKKSKRIINTSAYTSLEDKFTLDPNTGNLIIDLRSEVYLINPVNLNVIKEFTPVEFGINSFKPRIAYRNNKIFIDEFQFNLKIFNSDTKSKIFDGYANNWKVSDNGKYLLNNDKIYEIKENGLALINDLGFGGRISHADFTKDGSKLYYTLDETGVFEYNLLTNSTKDLNIEGQIYLVEYDDFTNKILIHKNLYNSNSQELTVCNENGYELFTSTANYVNKGLYTFLNDKLFSLKAGLVLENQF